MHPEGQSPNPWRKKYCIPPLSENESPKSGQSPGPFIIGQIDFIPGTLEYIRVNANGLSTPWNSRYHHVYGLVIEIQRYRAFRESRMRRAPDVESASMALSIRAAIALGIQWGQYPMFLTGSESPNSSLIFSRSLRTRSYKYCGATTWPESTAAAISASRFSRGVCDRSGC